MTLLPPTDLKDYEIDPITGFLPSPPPLRRLPKEFEQWETILDSFQAYILSVRIRLAVKQLPILSVDSLKTIPELRRAYVVLSFIAHAYMYGVMGSDSPDPILPASLAIPWFEVAKRLEVKPVSSYTNTVLWNWRLLDESGPMDLSNFATLHTFSGAFDEAWFYLVPATIEIKGAPILAAVLKAQRAILESNTEEVLNCLTLSKECIENMTVELKRMYEKCDPGVFWNRVRPFSGGSKNSPIFPNGLFYEGVLEDDGHINVNGPETGKVGTWRMYAGASAGQSPLIHSIDCAFSIEHLPTAKQCPLGSAASMLSLEYLEFEPSSPTVLLTPKDGSFVLPVTQAPVTCPVSGVAASADSPGCPISKRKSPSVPDFSEPRKRSNSDLAVDSKLENIKKPSNPDLTVELKFGIKKPTWNNAMLEMREAMPKKFQQFLIDLSNGPSIREFCEKSNPNVVNHFNEVLLAMKRFRDIHLQIVTKYIILQSKKSAVASVDTGGSSPAVGTGGTDLVPFLKQVRNETKNAQIPVRL
ncbi:Indoleamine 2,3-dioxygenase [Globomyces pollinis-pini]|nr:Indoleamine 2,3-dioxygenase [Globomyces pollinis-pini]